MSFWKEIKVIVPINIALIKYWGKRDEELILPVNDSLSITIDSLFAETHAQVFILDDQNGQQNKNRLNSDGDNEKDAEKLQNFNDVVILNDQELDLCKKPRYEKCFSEIRRIVKEKRQSSPRSGATYKFLINSKTNFPVAAGLASSAAGFAAIAYALGTIFDLDVNDICRIARLGSGSACRSVYGGLVQWLAGTDPSGLDSCCNVVLPANHWSSLRAVVVVVSDETKMHGSTDGMAATVATSALLQYRIQNCVERHLSAVKSAYLSRDFNRFAQYVMRDSNQLHAVCMDTYPPLMYLNDASRNLIHFVHAFNQIFGGNGPQGDPQGAQDAAAENGSQEIKNWLDSPKKLAYSFDAGPNCCLFVENSDLPELLSCLCYYFPNTNEEKFIRTSCSDLDIPAPHPNPNVRLPNLKRRPNTVQYIIVSTVGHGPRISA